MNPDGSRVAVIGAGVSGLVCARLLRDRGCRVEVFDKARGPGGRLATRRAESLRFDHGAQYFTARDPRFREEVAQWEREGLVAPWRPRLVSFKQGRKQIVAPESERWVGVPRMSALGRHLARDLELETSNRIGALHRGTDGIRLEPVDQGAALLGPFDGVVLAMPAPQAAELALDPAPRVAQRARSARYAPCWATMVCFADPVAVPFDAAFVEGGAFSWIARNASKPERGARETWVLHGSPAWSTEHFDLSPDEVTPLLLGALSRLLQIDLPETSFARSHRWAYALPTETLDTLCVPPDLGDGIAASGDWCGGPRVEGAWHSGMAVADAMAAWLTYAVPR